MEQFFEQPIKNCDSSGNTIEKCKSHCQSQSTANTKTESNSSSSFDCNICLDVVQDPVVTLCGHLYCWPCIYKWMNSNSDQHLNCPVCKAQVSENTLIPLYVQAHKGPAKLDHVPQRPRGLSPRCGAHGQDRGYFLHDPEVNQVYPFGFGFGGTTTYSLVIDMLGEMIYARNFGDSENMVYSYSNNYNVEIMSSTRQRRRLMKMDRSLSRVVLFLCCCTVLCLLLF